MTKIAFNIAALCLVALAGCTSGPQPFAETSAPAEGRLLKPEIVLASEMPAPAGYLALQIARDSFAVLAACAFDIVLNDEKVVQLYAGEGVVVKVEPGKVRARVEMGGFICPFYSTTTEKVVSPGERWTLRTGVVDMRPWIQFTTQK